MPFTKRSIEPVKLRQGALQDRSDISLGEEHEVIVNKSYTQILLQLSQLATFANEIFKDLSQECQGVITRTQKMKTRIWEIEQKSKQLNVLETELRKLLSGKLLSCCVGWLVVTESLVFIAVAARNVSVHKCCIHLCDIKVTVAFKNDKRVFLQFPSFSAFKYSSSQWIPAFDWSYSQVSCFLLLVLLGSSSVQVFSCVL